MQQTTKAFADRLKQLRLEHKLSQEEMGKIMAVSRGAIGYYENLERTPDIDCLAAVCNHFGVSADYLLGFTDVKTPNTDRRAVCEYTGLSEKAVEQLESETFDAELLSFIAETECLEFLADLRAFLEFSPIDKKCIIDINGNIEPVELSSTEQLEVFSDKYAKGDYYHAQTVDVGKVMGAVLRDGVITSLYRLKGEFNPLRKGIKHGKHTRTQK